MHVWIRENVLNRLGYLPLNIDGLVLVDELDHVSREAERLVGGYDGLVDLCADLLALFLISGQIRLCLLQKHRVGGQFGDSGLTALDFFLVGSGACEKFIDVELDE